MSTLILNEDWKDYDDRKTKDSRDPKKFSCTEIWEVQFLIKKIKKVYPYLTEGSIRSAIISCCLKFGAPHPREDFINSVTKTLGER